MLYKILEWFLKDHVTLKTEVLYLQMPIAHILFPWISCYLIAINEA